METSLTNYIGHGWPGKDLTASYFSSFCHLKILLTNSGRHGWPGKKVTASCFSSFCHSEMAFAKVIPSIRLQKKDLGIIFHYAYKYNIIIYTGSLSFYSKRWFENNYNYLSLVYRDFTIINGQLRSQIVLKVSQKADQVFMKAIFGKVIINIRLQKSDLERIFYYAYKYKIATCIGDLPFY